MPREKQGCRQEGKESQACKNIGFNFMDKKELKIEYTVWQREMPENYGELCRKAIAASGSAYSIYSDFAVGAAVLLENGEIVCGSNQENAAYPSGICAERTALFYAGATYPEIPVKALAIAASYKGKPQENFVPPCGACRQVMAEVIRRYGQDFDVIMTGSRESIVIKASALLPFSFELKA